MQETVSSDHPQTTTYRNSTHVRARYGGVSDMTLWRWLHDEELGFPQPIRINGRRFWSEERLAAWERLMNAREPTGASGSGTSES